MVGPAGETTVGIDEIEKRLAASAPDASLADLGTIVTTMKDIAEIRQTEMALRTKGREIRLELFKSAAAFLVPVVSLLALFGTVVAQNRQIEAGRQQLEDTEWRDLLGSLKGASDAVYSDPTVAPRLRSFFASASYGDQAKSIAGRLMGRISNPEGFTDLFNAVFGEIDGRNVGSVLDVFRTLLSSSQAIREQCNEMLTNARVDFNPALLDCAAFQTDQQAAELMKQFKVPSEMSSLRRSDARLSRELNVINGHVVDYLRATYRVGGAKGPGRGGLDLSGIWLVGADLSQVDFSDFNFSRVIFDGVNLSGAILRPRASVSAAFAPVGAAGGPGLGQPDFRGSTWWEADAVEPGLLRFLVEFYPPYLVPNIRYPLGYAISREAYGAKVAALCVKAGLACPASPKFGAFVPKAG